MRSDILIEIRLSTPEILKNPTGYESRLLLATITVNQTTSFVHYTMTANDKRTTTIQQANDQRRNR